MAYFEGDLHTVMAAHRADRATRDLNALDRAEATDEARMVATLERLRRATAAEDARAVTLRLERQGIEARMAETERDAARAKDTERGFRTKLQATEAHDREVRASTRTVHDAMGPAIDAGREATRKAHRREACAAGTKAICAAAARALSAAAPDHALLAATGKRYGNGAPETVLSRIRDDAHDAVAFERGVGLVIRPT